MPMKPGFWELSIFCIFTVAGQIFCGSRYVHLIHDLKDYRYFFEMIIKRKKRKENNGGLALVWYFAFQLFEKTKCKEEPIKWLIRIFRMPTEGRKTVFIKTKMIKSKQLKQV